MEQFARELVAADRAPASLAAEALTTITVPLSQAGYTLEGQTETTLTFGRTYRTTLMWVLSVCLFPIGIFIYLASAERAYITITFEAQGNDTVMRVAGEGTPEVRQAFETLSL
jgi:hypothetical protein